MKKQKKDDVYELMKVLTKHVGRARAISMECIYKEVYGKEPNNKINETRKIRKLIEKLRREGVPVCSVRNRNFHGYYIAAAGSELSEYCQRIRREALKKLSIEAKMRKTTLPQLINEISLGI